MATAVVMVNLLLTVVNFIRSLINSSTYSCALISPPLTLEYSRSKRSRQAAFFNSWCVVDFVFFLLCFRTSTPHLRFLEVSSLPFCLRNTPRNTEKSFGAAGLPCFFEPLCFTIFSQNDSCRDLRDLDLLRL